MFTKKYFESSMLLELHYSVFWKIYSFEKKFDGSDTW